MTSTTKPIAESNNFIVLDKYTKQTQISESYQSEGDLERELIQDLSNQGYEYLPALTTPDAMMANVRKQLQSLNKVEFTKALVKLARNKLLYQERKGRLKSEERRFSENSEIFSFLVCNIKSK